MDEREYKRRRTVAGEPEAKTEPPVPFVLSLS
jgi:hypothetical protein